MPERPPADEAQRPGVTVYKQDHRSIVWREPVAIGGRVVKRFEYQPWRQTLGLLTLLHPAQRELRWNRKCQQEGIPVTPIIEWSVHPVGAGCKVSLVTRYVGPSVHDRLHAGASPAEQRRLAEQLATTTARLLRRRIYFRDLKPSNVLIASDGSLQLIDVGSMRRARSLRRAVRMIVHLRRAALDDGVGQLVQARFARALCRACPDLDSWRKLGRLIGDRS